MKASPNDNGKVSDSGYTNTCVSQSQVSSCSSLSRKNNISSGYGGEPPSAFESSNYDLPEAIIEKEIKEHKKKKSETSTANVTNDRDLGKQINSDQQIDNGAYDTLENSYNFRSHCKKSEEVARVELIDARDLGEHNGDSNSTEPEGGVGTKTNPLDDITSNTNDGFSAVISLHNGLVIDTTKTLKTTLGYTKEEWFGRLFIEFVHPKDKSTFADHLAKNIALPYECSDNKLNGRQTGVFCCLRKYDEGRSATGSGSDGSRSVLTSSSLYVPFHLTTSINYYQEQNNDKKTRMMLVTITAQQLFHIYKTPEETIISTVFSICHDLNCILTHVDESVVHYLGYLPQDMIGRSLFDFYHPEDLPFIKDIYETVVKMEELPFLSRPYRFATQNGGYVVLETEWSSFIDPWSEKLEFVVGRHRILTGPANPDVFKQADDCQRSCLANISEEIIKKSKIIQAEIRALLNERIETKDSIEAFELSSRSKDFVTFVENLLQEVKPPALDSNQRASSHNQSIPDADGVMLGAISPQHEDSNSKSSTETPPSYHQLNYNETIDRFFKSQPITVACGDEENINLSGVINKYNNNSSGPPMYDYEKSSPHLNGKKDTIPNDSGGSGSGENLSSRSNNHTSSGSRDNCENSKTATNTMQSKGLKLPSLTKSLIFKHNKNMEKLMAQQHKERRSIIKKTKLLKDSKLKAPTKKSYEKEKDQTKNHATKRRNSQSAEEKFSKVAKYNENAEKCTVALNSSPANIPANTMNGNNFRTAYDSVNMIIGPSVTGNVPSQAPFHCCMDSENSRRQHASGCSALPAIIPLYYIPMARIRDDIVNSMAQSGINQFQQNSNVSYVAIPTATMGYLPAVCAPTQVSMDNRAFGTTANGFVHQETPQSNFGVIRSEKSYNRNCPASRATSVNCPTNSIMAISELSKKVLTPGEHISYSVSVDDARSTLIPNIKSQIDTSSKLESSLEDSSDSSFYGNFLETSSDESCVPHRKTKAAKETLWVPTKPGKEQLDSLRKGPPWQEGVKMTDELIYQYQMKPKPLAEVLEADLKALKTFSQPQMVKEQLAQLYSDMQVCCNKAKCQVIEGTSTSGHGSGDPLNMMAEPDHQECDCMMSMIYEENAPLPPP